MKKPNVGLVLILLAVVLVWAGIWTVTTMADQPYLDCTAVRAAGLKNIPVGDPRAANLKDSDGDGLTCDR